MGEEEAQFQSKIMGYDVSNAFVDLERDWEPTTLKDALQFFEDEIKDVRKEINFLKKMNDFLLDTLETHSHDRTERVCVPLTRVDVKAVEW